MLACVLQYTKEKHQKIMFLSFKHGGRRDHQNCCRDNKQTLLIMSFLIFFPLFPPLSPFNK